MRAIVCVLIAAVAASASGSQKPRIRFGPGVCGPIDPVYNTTATMTGGQPFPLSTTEIAQSSRIMESSLLKDLILWASDDRERTYSVPVDASVGRVMFSGSFDATGGSLTLIAPDGTAVQSSERIDDATLSCGRITTVDTPQSGTWLARVVPSGRFWLRVHAKSGLSLRDAAFVEPAGEQAPGQFVEVQGQPVVGSAARLQVSISPEISNPVFELVSLDAGPLQTVDLQPGDDLLYTGTLTVIEEPFRLLVTGLDERGNPVQRIWPWVFHGETIEVIAPSEDAIEAGTAKPVTFRIRNHGPVVRLALVASNDRGGIIAIEPATLELAANSETSVNVPLSVPADAMPGSRISVRLTATVEGTPSMGGFNSASKTFTVD